MKEKPRKRAHCSKVNIGPRNTRYRAKLTLNQRHSLPITAHDKVRCFPEAFGISREYFFQFFVSIIRLINY